LRLDLTRSEEKTSRNWFVEARTKLALSIGLNRWLFAVRKVLSAMSGVQMELEETVGIKARSVLWYLTFVGFAMNYMIR
jgi:hypothetical protein